MENDGFAIVIHLTASLIHDAVKGLLKKEYESLKKPLITALEETSQHFSKENIEFNTEDLRRAIDSSGKSQNSKELLNDYKSLKDIIDNKEFYVKQFMELGNFYFDNDQEKLKNAKSILNYFIERFEYNLIKKPGTGLLLLKTYIEEQTQISHNEHEQIITYLNGIEKLHNNPIPVVVTIGSSSGEYILSLDNDVKLGQKHKITHTESIGGSGVDYSLRLIGAGIPVFPILYIAEDVIGLNIQKTLLNIAKKASLPEQILSFMDCKDFFIKDIKKTPRSTIIVERSKERRTIFTEDDEEQGPEHFKEHLEERIHFIKTNPLVTIKAVMIGHIHTDTQFKGECTKHIIRSLKPKDAKDGCFIFVNFGNSQISLGANFWKDELKKVDIFQLNISEIRKLFFANQESLSLAEIIKRLKELGLAAIITLDKFGAVGTYKDDGRIIFAWPFESDNYVDSTGSGDAFAAGLVANLYEKDNLTSKSFTFGALLEAIDKARYWAAYACTALGGAGLPDISFEDFCKKLSSLNSNPPDTDIGRISQILGFIDKSHD